jgi:hypothetical protein
MLIGTPKEIKNHEYRVAVTPASVRPLVDGGQCCGCEIYRVAVSRVRRPGPLTRAFRWHMTLKVHRVV